MASREAVRWNGSGLAVRRSGPSRAITSPSSTRRSAGSDRTRLDHLGHPVGDVVEAAGEDAHRVAVAVQAHPHAVELPLHAGGAGALERLCQRGRGGGEHRREGPPHLEAEPAERVGPVDQGGHGHLDDVAAERHGAPHLRSRHPGGGGQGVEQHPALRTLPQARR
ncbi:hypothetical protein GCM10025868_42160 [Angustibacter aerolatus]|uniref:Uncharacterized protein n=1 Tax=Angustibacter aerolatus TaxID=1162965 RepID=A0ABQ6JN32_9ACTN|nr:hypothetical protein GCM10025868_42160 [Angustibacter aerolatus]